MLIKSLSAAAAAAVLALAPMAPTSADTTVTRTSQVVVGFDECSNFELLSGTQTVTTITHTDDSGVTRMTVITTFDLTNLSTGAKYVGSAQFQTFTLPQGGSKTTFRRLYASQGSAPNAYLRFTLEVDANGQTTFTFVQECRS